MNSYDIDQTSLESTLNLARKLIPATMDSTRHLDDDYKGGEKAHQEHIEDVNALDANIDTKDVMRGTVGLTGEGGAVVLIPTPSADPSGKREKRHACEPSVLRSSAI